MMLAPTTHASHYRHHRPGGDGGYLMSPLIAIVDDDVQFLELMDALLRDEGFRTIGCTTARQVAPRLGLACPSLIILDLWIETRDEGWRILDQLRRDPRFATVPVLICSADHERLAAHADRLAEYRCAALRKPFDLDDLLATVRALLAAWDVHATNRSPRP